MWCLESMWLCGFIFWYRLATANLEPVVRRFAKEEVVHGIADAINPCSVGIMVLLAAVNSIQTVYLALAFRSP